MKFATVFLIFLAACFLISFFKIRRTQSAEWWTADRGSAGLAPLPGDEPRAVVQIYAARTVSWRGYFAVHTWIAVKKKNAKNYQTYQVIGWRLMRNLSAVVVEDALPDTKWFGNIPELLRDLRGPAAETAIPKIEDAATTYPYPRVYRAWPGPNSNSFVSYILRRTPELGIELPSNAIGKDWINEGDFFGRSETGQGFQFSVYGVLGLTVGLGEGIEINILGCNFGIDFLRPAIKLPFIGRVGLQDRPVLNDPDSVEASHDQSVTQPLTKDLPEKHSKD